MAAKSNRSEEKVSCEIIKLPSMMWKRSVDSLVQASGFASRVLVALLLITIARGSAGAELVIEIPESGAGGGSYRLNYEPAHGSPPANHTVPARASTINFQGLPGTKYHFELYYSNDTFADLLTWNQTIITAPEPPTNLTVTLGRNKQATVTWAPPANGNYSGFRFKVVPLTERAEEGPRVLEAAGRGNFSLLLRELAAGATYALHASTLLDGKESAAYASTNFTTKPNTPGKFIVWFRNETTLLVLWQPPYPPGFYTHYKVSIVPHDARESELYVEKEGEPPGPAQAAFKGLVPGRAYNISVQTVSEPAISAPTTAQYRTVPLRPRNVSLVPGSLTTTSFAVEWLAPLQFSEFERYQVQVAGARRLPPLVRARNDSAVASFDQLEPGATYTVTVKTMSGKVTSWPTTADVTLKPWAVRGVWWRAGEGDSVLLWWAPADNSTQDHYKIWYHEAGPSRDDSSALTAAGTNVTLDALLPGRNYSVSVSAVSRGVEGAARGVALLTRPLAPALRAWEARGAALELAWSADVNSRQDRYELAYRRRQPPPADDAPLTVETRDTNATLSGLSPGAVYEISLYALSHGLRSDAHSVLRPVRPLPPAALSVERLSSDAARVRFAAGGGSVGHFVLRYRHDDDAAWTRLTLPPTDTHYELGKMRHGARYEVQLDTQSLAGAEGAALESGAPLAASVVVRPDPVSDVAALVDTRNLTLEWPAPAGRVDRYALAWGPPGAPPRAANVSAPPGARTVRAALSGLQPGAAVTVSIAAISHHLSSDLFTMHTRTRPLIQSEMNIVPEPGAGDDNDTMPAFLVVYTRTPASATEFDSYQFRLEADGEQPRTVSRAADAPGQQISFKQLVPGRLYNITMWTVSHNVTSHPVQRQARLYPRPVAALNATEVEARALTLRWAAPDGDWTDFEVQYLTELEQLRAATTDQLWHRVAGLQPHTLYTFTVEARAGSAAALLTRARGVSVAVRTREAPPAAPSRFLAADVAPAAVSFSWELPARAHHGVLRRFVLSYAPQGSEQPPVEMEFPPDARNGTVGGLAPGGTYEFRLSAETGAGRGPAATWTQHMAIAAPPRPPPSNVPAQVRRAPTTAVVRFRADYFSAANGNVTAYTLVVAEEPRNDTPARLPAWRDVHALPVWPPYQVTEPYYPFRQSAVEEFTLGSERCELSGRAYCNGPLKPSSRYYVKLRAFTAPDKYTDTQYALVYTDADNTAWIAGGAAGGAALLAALGAALLLRRRRTPRAAPAPPAPRLSRPVRVADFLDHYRLMSADSDFRFSEEFEELKQVGREQPCAAADLPVNRPKNRFTNILPYDHSRFKLQPVDDEEGSDYINANYVPGHHSPREFIVTQGPLHSTRDDFWRMVWESGSRAIVMLTRCVEKGREKCDRYWPYDTRPTYYGELCVTVLNESRLPDWTVSELLLARGSEQRRLLHFHFTTWPDFGVPDPPTKLARFVRAFRERCGAEARPVVVHCSAGVGRSGTFVALDRALQQLAARADHLDVLGVVAALRRERAFCVQTEQQYICIHTCLAAALSGAPDLPAPAHPAHPRDHVHHNQAFDDDEGIAESGM